MEHCIGPLGLGTLVVKPERHVTAVAGPGPQMAMFATGVQPDPSEVATIADQARRLFGLDG